MNFHILVYLVLYDHYKIPARLVTENSMRYVQVNNKKYKLDPFNEVINSSDTLNYKFLSSYTTDYLKDLYKNKDKPQNKIIRYALREGRLPTELDSVKLFKYIKDLVIKIKSNTITKEEIADNKELLNLSLWNNEYIHLSTKGVYYNYIIDQIGKQGTDFLTSKTYKKYINDLFEEYKNGTLDIYFKRKLCIYFNSSMIK